eukprot:TRINITY_DN74128_c0_g1_i1.p2 TRINITY_DN74128_c0_g1~~TRINITY_DN74128_c0_g1_i1.p2  ORF type:complete len:105 (+),score=2.17 TRINITY_DN74128_c0_g1_i1:21-335(+)
MTEAAPAHTPHQRRPAQHSWHHSAAHRGGERGGCQGQHSRPGSGTSPPPPPYPDTSVQASQRAGRPCLRAYTGQTGPAFSMGPAGGQHRRLQCRQPSPLRHHSR